MFWLPLTAREGSASRLLAAGEKAVVPRRLFLKIYLSKFCNIWQNFYFYHILNNENFKMEVEQTKFVTHLVITVQLYY